VFAKVFIEITNACDLSCSFCPPTTRRAELLSRGRFELILDRLAGHGDHLYFHLKGEPLLHPDLGLFLSIAESRGFTVTLTTNGTRLAEKADILLEARNLRKLGVSLHSHAGLPGLEAYWRGVAAFLDLHRGRPAFPVSLRLWNLRGGRLTAECAGLWELLRSRYPALGAFGVDGAWPRGNRLDDRVFLNGAERFDWPDPALPAGEDRGFCHGLGNQIGVLVDGTVVPCCMDGEGTLALGNLHATPLAEILDSPRARAIREGFAAKRLVEPLCRRCGYRRLLPGASTGVSPTSGTRSQGQPAGSDSTAEVAAGRATGIARGGRPV
jgi:radical SAM protein with 4Fe4S-binding SPASM domain